MRMPSFSAWLLLSVFAALPGAGCDPCANIQCGACAAAIFLHVNDATTGDPIPGVTVTGSLGGCDDAIGCQIGSAAGTYQLTIEAPGYAPTDVTVEVPATEEDGCCSCGYEQISKTVTLTKA